VRSGVHHLPQVIVRRERGRGSQRRRATKRPQPTVHSERGAFSGMRLASASGSSAAAAATVTTVFGVALDGRTVTGTSGRVAYPIGIVWTGAGQLALAANASHVVLNIALGP